VAAYLSLRVAVQLTLRVCSFFQVRDKMKEVLKYVLKNMDKYSRMQTFGTTTLSGGGFKKGDG
jgi:hypothetical protein